MDTNKSIVLAKQLIDCHSLTTYDAGCQEILINHLKKMDFCIEQLTFGEVNNFWARRGSTSPLFVFVGHTDVVPPGPLDNWNSNPFIPEIRDGYLYGRGAADMKGSLAAMLVACENFIHEHPLHTGSIAWLITSDEEGPSINGTAKVVEALQKRNEKMDWCLVGEPTCEQQFGDTLKIGRRGSLSGKLIIYGQQGHIAYPHLADNPIHRALPALSELISKKWDAGNEFFQPTSLQFSNIQAGTGANNVIPGELHIQFNLRYSPAITTVLLEEKIKTVLDNHHLRYSIQWHHSGLPFLTKKSPFVEACCNAIKTIIGVTPQLSTQGGTSDGRFIAPTGCQVVEFGPCNRTIHQINECVALSDLVLLTSVYQRLLENLLLEN